MNLETKVLEVRDEGTHIPALAIKMTAKTVLEDYYLYYRCGYPRSGKGIVLMNLGDQRATSDPYRWGSRTMKVAHEYILTAFDRLNDGDVVDVQYILGETNQPKLSERNKS